MTIGPIPGIESALRALASETGRQFLTEANNPMETLATQHAAAHSKLPAISRNDDRAFIENLAAIAAGKLRVV